MAHLKKNADGHLAKVASNHHLAKCTAGEKSCWVRWRYEWCCIDVPDTGGTELPCPLQFVVSVTCRDTPPEYTGSWHLIGHPGATRCIYMYDQLLPDSCSVDGDCPDPPDDPDIAPPDGTGCCCILCVYTFTATYNTDTEEWSGPEHGSAKCMTSGVVGTVNEWQFLGRTGSTCRYRIRILGECCVEDGDCDTWPSDPDLPAEPFECLTCDLIPCRLRMTVYRTHPVCGGAGTRYKPTASIDGSYIVFSTAGITTAYPGQAVQRYGTAGCLDFVDLSPVGTAQFIPNADYPTIEQIESGAGFSFLFAWAYTEIGGGGAAFGIQSIAGNISYYSGECCGYPRMIQVDVDNAAGETNPTTVTFEWLDCPAPCTDITAIFSGFAEGTCGSCAAINGSVDLTVGESSCIFSGEQAGTGNGVGINYNVDPATGLAVWTLVFTTGCGDFTWTAPGSVAPDDCPPMGGWTLLIDPGTCGSPAVSLTY